MKNAFHGYYKPSEEYFKKLWEEALFCFDANVLLDLFRMSQEPSADLLRVMEKLKDRAWVPHQAALEYHRNLHKVIADQEENCARTSKLIEEFRNKLEGTVQEKRNYPFLPDSTWAKLRQATEAAEKEIRSAADRLKRLLTDNKLAEEVGAVCNPARVDGVRTRRLTL